MSNSRAAQRRTSLSISQNFLTSAKTIGKLLSLTNIGPGDTVLDIGAGKGHITRALAARGARVLAYELDGALAARLTAQFQAAVRVKVIPGDFLAMPLPRAEYKVFANIPFSLTTAILRKLTEGKNLPGELYLVMERGAAMRFMGLPRESAHSLALKPFFTLDIVHRFARGDFHPAPRVDVVMLHLSKKQTPDMAPGKRENFAAFIERCIRNGLTGRAGLLTAPQIHRALRDGGLDPIPQSGQILYIQWLCLFRYWEKHARVGRA